VRSASFEGTQRACSVCRPDRLAQQINDQDALFSRISDLQDQGIYLVHRPLTHWRLPEVHC
jgi:hypothetical protein